MKLEISNLVKYMKKLSFFNYEILNSGNISIRLSGGLIAIKPSGMSYNKISKNEVSIVNLKGKHLSGLKPSSDIFIHLEIYIKRPEINCVIHTHSHYATLMSLENEPLKVLSTLHADYFGKEIYCMPYLNHRTENIGKRFVETKEDIVLLGRHGALLADKNPEKAINKIVVLEEIAKINFHAGFLSKEIKSLDKNDINSLNEYYSKKYGQKTK